jgi:hypothetical protein
VYVSHVSLVIMEKTLLHCDIARDVCGDRWRSKVVTVVISFRVYAVVLTVLVRMKWGEWQVRERRKGPDPRL